MFEFFRKKKIFRLIKNPDLKELKARYSSVWKGRQFPEMQNKFTKNILNDYKNIPAIVALITQMKKCIKKRDMVLEIGCSTGYHGKIFEIEKLGVNYEGCDYSRAFIKKAKELYPGFTFKVADSTNLKYSKSLFDLVISGCCILHIVNYKKAIAETARVSKRYVIFHRTPVINIKDTTFMTKQAYGAEMLDIIFNEDDLYDSFAKAGLYVFNVKTTGCYEVKGFSEKVLIKNYLCKKNV